VTTENPTAVPPPYPGSHLLPFVCPHCQSPVDTDDGGQGFDWCPHCLKAHCSACDGALVHGLTTCTGEPCPQAHDTGCEL
jgi:hypothetical protein